MEVPCSSVRDVIIADKAGVDQIDLGSVLEVGKVSGTVGALKTAKKRTNLPIYMMVRPRPQGFDYDEADFESMLYDAKNFIDNGADGICFGLLNEDATINEERTRQMVKIIGKKDAIFNRAFDLTPNLENAIQTLIKLNVTRVLTSGGWYGDIMDHLDLLEHLQASYGDKINIIIGGGVNEHNALEILNKTKVHQIHFSGKIDVYDNTYFVTSPHQDKSAFTYLGAGEKRLKAIINEVKKAEKLR